MEDCGRCRSSPSPVVAQNQGILKETWGNLREGAWEIDFRKSSASWENPGCTNKTSMFSGKSFLLQALEAEYRASLELFNAMKAWHFISCKDRILVGSIQCTSNLCVCWKQFCLIWASSLHVSFEAAKWKQDQYAMPFISPTSPLLPLIRVEFLPNHGTFHQIFGFHYPYIIHILSIYSIG